MNLEEFYKLKDNYLQLDLNLVNSINNIKNSSNIKYKESKKTKKVFKNKNDYNIILNKISEINYKTLVEELFCSIIFDNDKIINFLNFFFNKMIRETPFIVANSMFYIEFLKSLNYHYKELNIDIVINKIESFFNKIYTENYSEADRTNYLFFIYNLCKNSFFGQNLLIEITEFLFKLEDTKFLYDIFKWFSINKKLLKVNKYIKLLHTKIKISESNKRINTLLKSLFQTNILVKNVDIKKVVIKENHNSNNTEIENLIQEYLILEDLNEIKFYISDYCIDAKKKNNFCYIIIKSFFKENEENINKIFNLLDYIIKNKVIYKSNLSRGLIYYYKSESKINKSIILKFIKFLKKNNITRSIEFIINKYDINSNA